ncbi:MAG TPA: hypothetical protein VFP27_11995 [Mycobacterium sp.]|nr:hypothetical protein [Mycobacterium sp.]
MTDTTKPNGDRDRPSEGTASSGRTSPPLDMALLRELADEFGYWPATTDEADIDRHRRLNAALDRNYRPHRLHHLEAAHKKSGKTPEGG